MAMYASFFCFKENPFNLTPDPKYLFLSQNHKEVLESLLRAIRKRKGLVTVTGEIGTGKTTICHALLYELDASTKTALIFNPFMSDAELLITMNQEFGVNNSSKAKPKKDCFSILERFLVENFGKGGNAVLLIDEAQNLSHSVLEQIRILSNLEMRKEKLLQIVLLGQFELNELLTSSDSGQLNELIRVRHELRSLDYEDVERYVAHRLEVAGGLDSVHFTRGAFKEIYAHSRGNPRRINVICDRALLLAYVREKHTITKGMIGTAINELQWYKRSKKAIFARWETLVPTVALLLFLLVAVAFNSTLRQKIFPSYLNEGGTTVHEFRQSFPIGPKPKAVDSQTKADIVTSFNEVKGEQEPYPYEGSFVFFAQTTINENQQTDEVSVQNASRAGQDTPSPELTFSVQVGAFLERRNAERVAADLQEKGYQPYIPEILGYGGRVWHSVRILDSVDLKQAEQAVVEYEKKEGKPAIITRTDSLDPVAKSGRLGGS